MIFINNESFNLLKDIKINGMKVKGNPKLNEGGDRIEFIEIKTIEELIKYLNKNITLDDIILNGGERIKENVNLNPKDELFFFTY